MMILSEAMVEALKAHAWAHYPEEACGLIAGQEGRAVRFYPVDNILHSRTAYEMDPLQQVLAMIEIEEQGWDILAIFHSHPDGPPRPSATDVALAYYPESLYLILSLETKAQSSLRAFRIVDGGVSEENCFVE